MRYRIRHITTYHYSQTVHLDPHVVRLRPRSDSTQQLLNFCSTVQPTPTQITDSVDLDGNSLLQLTFQDPTDQLVIDLNSDVETYRANPFDFLLEPWAVQLPLDYPSQLAFQLQGYLQSPQTFLDPVAVVLAQDILLETQGNVVAFLGLLNQRIYGECQHLIRETGIPWPAGVTWKRRAGACRDFTVLFMEVCRAVGLASRFVSGYQEGDVDSEDRHLHAWVEVYLPGAGWRGYDPTHGLAVGDRHIAVAASPIPSYAAPITGRFRGLGATSSMSYQLKIQHL